RRLTAAPKAAVLMEAGRPYVFVQIGGERFARRFVEIATRDGDLVGLKSGVQPGDRVVTRGAYDVQLASAAKGLPAEGHVHRTSTNTGWQLRNEHEKADSMVH